MTKGLPKHTRRAYPELMKKLGLIPEKNNFNRRAAEFSDRASRLASAKKSQAKAKKMKELH